MRISIGWIALFLLLTMCTLTALLPFRRRATKEGFIGGGGAAVDISSGNPLDIELLACPVQSVSFVEKATGLTFCCNGTIVDGKCNGKTLCSTSAAKSSVPNCSQYKYSLYEEKGAERCPASLPMYWQNSEDGQGKKGCCERGGRTKTGDYAGTKRVCYLYPTLQEEQHYVDSCFNQKRMETEPCFSRQVPGSFQVSKSLVQQYSPTGPAQIVCHYNEPSDPTSVLQTCTTRQSGELQYQNTPLRDTWKDDPNIASKYCDAQYSVHVLKQVPPLPANFPTYPWWRSWHLNWTQQCFAYSVPNWSYS